MTSRARCGVLAAACGAALVACNTFLGFDELVATDGAAGDGVGLGFDSGSSPGADAGACDAVLCEDFEHGLSPSWLADVEPPEAGFAAAESTPTAHAGAHALHLHLDATAVPTPGNLVAQVRRAVAFPPSFFVRVFVYLPSPGIPNAVRLLALTNDPPAKPTFLLEDGGHLGLTDVDGTPHYAPEAFAYDRWVCVELSVSTLADGRARSVRLYQGGAAILGRDAATSVPLALLFLQALFPDASAQAAVDVLMDDLVVAAAPVGCTR